MKVLIVDDEILVRKGLAMGIDWGSLGFDEIKEASNGIEALEISRELDPDLVLTDIRMPKMDGFELIEQLKIYCPDTVTIVLSCLNDTEHVRHAMQFGGALDYIPKLSMSTEELAKIIEKVKKYMGKQCLVITEESKHVHVSLSLEQELELKRSLESGNKEKGLEIIHDMFQQIPDTKIASLDTVEWHEIIGILSSGLKKYAGSIYDIKVGDKLSIQWIEESQDIRELRQRLIDVLRYAFDYIGELKNQQYGKEVTLAIEYLYSHFNEAIKLHDVSVEVGIHESYLSKKFKDATGINFIDYLNQIRIDRAKELLQNPERLVYEVAEIVGYSNESYFSRIFKQYEGISPKQYQKQCGK